MYGPSIKDVHIFLGIFDLLFPLSLWQSPLKKTYTFDRPRPPPTFVNSKIQIFVYSRFVSSMYLIMNICKLFHHIRKFERAFVSNFGYERFEKCERTQFDTSPSPLSTILHFQIRFSLSQKIHSYHLLNHPRDVSKAFCESFKS